MMVDVSIILTTHNSSKTIRATISSVLNQSFTYFELIIIDDGSADETVDLIHKISDKRIRLIEQQHSGAEAVRNMGINQSSGEFVAFIDHDDLWMPEKLELQVNALRNNKDAGAAYCWTAMIDEDGSYLCCHAPVDYQGNVYATLMGDCFLASGSNILVRRECINKVGGYDQRYTNGADWEFYVRLARHYNFIRIPSFQVLYRQLPDSLAVANLDRTEKNLLEVIGQIAKSAPGWWEKNDRDLTISRMYCHLIYLCLFRMPIDARLAIAKKYLIKSVRKHKGIFFCPRYHVLLFNLLVLHFIPSEKRLDCQLLLLRIYGRLQIIFGKQRENLQKIV